MEYASGAPKPMPFHLLEEITYHFSKQRRLGRGSYGDVYLGEHKGGEKIAVKLLKEDLDHLDDENFDKEYQNLASLHHKNVVRLVGYCNETKKERKPYEGRMVLVEETKRALCFEYMPNKSLDNFIYDESNARNWRTRYAIIKGICEGLEYLHEKIRPPMWHLDLKPANVLLDKNMSPKVADFGLARLFSEEWTKKTESSIGTLGYRPPEYIEKGLLSIKFDIFSLGVVVIKIMTGRDGYARIDDMSSQQFVEHVHMDWMKRLQEPYMYSKQTRRCIEIALSCVENDRRKRPSIGEIVNDLKKTESTIHILDALRNGSESPIDNDHQMCPCICNETTMLNALKNKLISYPLHVTDNVGRVHTATVTTIGDPAGDMSTYEPVKPRIKIIKTADLGIVMCIDVHSTEPWILVTNEWGNATILNHQNQTRVMAFHNTRKQGQERLLFGAAKFIEPLRCFVAGDSEGFIHVYSYVKMEKLQSFRAHARWVTSLAVHPSEPFVLSASHDDLVKLWNWEAGWQCIRTFEGHSGVVLQVRFNPQTKGNTFASCSLDSTIKIWNIHSPTPITTLHYGSEHLSCLYYFTPSGDKQYLVTGSYFEGNAQIWDLQTNTCIRKIEELQKFGHSITMVESVLGRPILLTVSHDGTIAFCNSNTHRYENRVNFNLGRVMDFAYISMTKRLLTRASYMCSLAIGCDKGIAIMEID